MAKLNTERGRFSSRKKMAAVLRVLRGEALDLVLRDAGITAAKLSEWRDHFLVGRQTRLTSRGMDGRDDEVTRLKALVGAHDAPRTLARGRQPSEGRRPFSFREADAMSQATSPSTRRRYGVVRVCEEWQLPRATFYAQRMYADRPPRVSAKRGPKTHQALRD